MNVNGVKERLTLPMFGPSSPDSLSILFSIDLPPLLHTIILINTETIKSHAFDKMATLTTIVLPNTLTHIEQDAFIGCPNVSIFFSTADITENFDDNWNSTNRPVYFAGEWDYVAGVPTPL